MALVQLFGGQQGQLAVPTFTETRVEHCREDLALSPRLAAHNTQASGQAIRQRRRADEISLFKTPALCAQSGLDLFLERTKSARGHALMHSS